MATKCELVSRRQNKYKSFESLRNGIGQLLQVNDAILDGDLVCLDASVHDRQWLLTSECGLKNRQRICDP